MGTIALEGMEFFAYHGYHAEEQTIGNLYEVDLLLEANFEEGAANDRLSGTVDYGQVFQVVAEIMKQPARLLEYLSRQICLTLHEQFPNIERIQATVTKHNPPMGGICRKAKVTYTWPAQ